MKWDRRAKRETGRRKVLPGIVGAAFAASVITFFLLLKLEESALQDYEKTLVWVTAAQLSRGTEITEQNVHSYFTQVELERARVPEGGCISPDALVGMRTVIGLARGTILQAEMFTSEGVYAELLREPVIAGCRAEDLYQLDNGILRKGDRIHIYIAQEGEIRLLWENVRVYQTFDSVGNGIGADDQMTAAARINILLEKEDAEIFYRELERGVLRVVKVWE